MDTLPYAKTAEFRGGPLDGEVRRVGPGLRVHISTNAFNPPILHVYMRPLNTTDKFDYAGTIPAT